MHRMNWMHGIRRVRGEGHHLAQIKKCRMFGCTNPQKNETKNMPYLGRSSCYQANLLNSFLLPALQIAHASHHRTPRHLLPGTGSGCDTRPIGMLSQSQAHQLPTLRVPAARQALKRTRASTGQHGLKQACSLMGMEARAEKGGEGRRRDRRRCPGTCLRLSVGPVCVFTDRIIFEEKYPAMPQYNAMNDLASVLGLSQHQKKPKIPK